MDTCSQLIWIWRSFFNMVSHSKLIEVKNKFIGWSNTNFDDFISKITCFCIILNINYQF